MIFTRWTAPSRRLAAAEVHAGFDAHPDETLLFAFTTDRMSVGEHEGAFSLKVVSHGREDYRIGRRRVALVPGRVLLTGAGLSYTSSIATPRTRAISCFLPASVLGGVTAALTERPERQLDGVPTAGVVDVPPVAFRAEPRLAAAIGRLATAVDAMRPSSCFLEELSLHAAGRAVGQALALPPLDAFPAARRATREELAARVLRARELIEDTGGRVTLAQMADAVHLSRYHFLRVFRGVIGVTPARYARRVRLARGLARLDRGESARAAARAAGFSSGSAFLRSVRRT